MGVDDKLLHLIQKLEQQPARTIWPDEEEGTSPFFHYIEALSSDDTTLLEISQGEYQLLTDQPPHHLDSLLIEARTRTKAEKKPLPVAPLLTPQDQLIEHYQLLFDLSPENSKSDDDSRIRQTIIGQAPEFVRAPLSSLSSIPISKMMVNNAHQGNYLIVRAVSQAVRLVAIQVVVEDHEGNAVDLALYNCLETSGLDREGILELIPVGQILLIREPWLTRGRTGGHVTIRVESPTDIIFLPPCHPLLEKYPENWKVGSRNDVQGYEDMGNEATKNGRFESAIQAYSCGLAIDPTASVLRLNRSVCYLNINKPSMALDDARIVSEGEALEAALRSKARYRMALAHYALDQFNAALEILQGQPSTQISPEYSELEEKARQRLVEQAQGYYDWFALNKTAKEINGYRQITDVADFVGPVKVAQMSTMGGGRGLITTRDVYAGEILVVSKPFAFVSSVEYPEFFRVFRAGGGIQERIDYELNGRAMRRLAGDRSSASALFLDLHSDSPIESMRITGDLPTFYTKNGRHWEIPGEYPVDDINAHEVGGRLLVNAFGDQIEQSRFGKNLAVYLFPSMINHSCYGTAVRASVGSIMVMRASRNLKAGEGITYSYVGGDQSSFISRGSALGNWGIDCRCELCMADREDGESLCEDREEYAAELEELRTRILPGDSQDAEDAEELLHKIRETYDVNRTAPRGTLALAQRVFAFSQELFNPNTATQLYMGALRSYGIHVKDKPLKKVPQNNSQLHRDSLIIGTESFPSQIGTVLRCIEIMATLAELGTRQGKVSLASHWAVACLWVHEAYYGPGKQFLWYTLNIEADAKHSLVVLLEGFQ